MTEQASNDEALVSLVKQTVVTEILGILELSEGADAELIDEGAGNSTRWVFDVDTIDGGSLEVQLIDMRTGRPAETDIAPSFHLTPLDKNAAISPLWGETKGTKITLHCVKACKFRVDVDIIGTNRR